MPKIKFLQDFQGKETKEVFYKEGQEVELDENLTSVLVKEGRAEYVKAATPIHYGAQVTDELRDDEKIYEQFKKEAVDLLEEVPPDPEPELKPKSKRGKK